MKGKSAFLRLFVFALLFGFFFFNFFALFVFYRFYGSRGSVGLTVAHIYAAERGTLKADAGFFFACDESERVFLYSYYNAHYAADRSYFIADLKIVFKIVRLTLLIFLRTYNEKIKYDNDKYYRRKCQKRTPQACLTCCRRFCEKHEIHGENTSQIKFFIVYNIFSHFSSVYFVNIY